MEKLGGGGYQDEGNMACLSTKYDEAMNFCVYYIQSMRCNLDHNFTSRRKKGKRLQREYLFYFLIKYFHCWKIWKLPKRYKSVINL